MESGPGRESQDGRRIPERTSKVQGFEEKRTRLRAGRSYSKGLVRSPTEMGSPRKGWVDERLRVLSELLPTRLSHRAPNLSRRRRALTRYDVRGLTARADLAPAG